MAAAEKVPVHRYLRLGKLPHIWCPGCGHGIALQALIRAIHHTGLPQDRTVIVSGIGCSSRATGYLNFDTLHTTHGRALAFATGIKMANPDLHVIVITGDGDAAAIGGNHLIHAARRNIGITCVCFNNNIYGMTSGQYSPLTPTEALATTAPYGNIETPFDLCELVKAAGASYVARSTTYHARQLEKLIARGLQNDGFSFIEAVVQCPTYYGRKNRLGEAYRMMQRMAERSVPASKAAAMTPEELAGKIVIGELWHRPRLEYTRAYDAVIGKAGDGQ
ncbi:MAG: 2-oxoacid:ferredoxin oxidoreductase subunit beta [Symbiobacterium sp.]|uniref:2-oxoacid:ferredoxin oxidoreductase subunit beta n=1 Tax=Symbiobacterium sp. TaxID=1971213 RepID=UPI00346403C1